MRQSTRMIGSIVLLLCARSALAGGGPFGIDHEWAYDNHGIWNRNYQLVVEYGLVGAEIAGGLWEGGETELGRTFWQSIDASAAGGIVTQVMKTAFSRVRPIDSNGDPNLWFKGHGNQSFPSGEVMEVSSIVTPFILEYGKEHPMVYGLELLPLYDAVARMKSQAHWQSDVLSGFALGTGAGFIMHGNPGKPYILRIMPNGIYVGLKTH